MRRALVAICCLRDPRSRQESDSLSELTRYRPGFKFLPDCRSGRIQKLHRFCGVAIISVARGRVESCSSRGCPSCSCLSRPSNFVADCGRDCSYYGRNTVLEG